MKERKIGSELKTELLAQPVLGNIVREISRIPESVLWVGLSGSKARGAELGTVSDDDLVILLGKNLKEDPLNMKNYDDVLLAINCATQELIKEKKVVPIFASTIRLEDAEMTMARLCNTTGLPIHMVHLLVYPSTEAAIAFEPPLLNRGLFGRSITLFGDQQMAGNVALSAANQTGAIGHEMLWDGLDGISDNFRMLMVNRHILPADFLGPQMIHVLDYTLKWIMAGEIERRWGVECGTWGEINQWFTKIGGCWEIVGLIKEIRDVRLSDASNLSRVEKIAREVISAWPFLVSIRKEEI